MLAGGRGPGGEAALGVDQERARRGHPVARLQAGEHRVAVADPAAERHHAALEDAGVGLDDGGKALFEGALCSVCHVPSMKTRSDYPIAQLAGIDAPIYTDFLLHDLGDALADSMTDGAADPRAWRTAPLIGMRFQKVFLHDGRVNTIDDAILARAEPDPGWNRVDDAPFDFERRRVSVLLACGAERKMIVKGAPEHVLGQCTSVIGPDGAVLVRPDGFVAWRAAGGSGATVPAMAEVLTRVLCRDGSTGGRLRMVTPVAESEEGGEPVCYAPLVCEECGAVTSEGHRAGCSLSVSR